MFKKCLFIYGILVLLPVFLFYSCQSSLSENEPAIEEKQNESSSSNEPAATPASTLVTGEIQGRVALEGSAPEPQKLLVVKDRDVCGQTPLFDERLLVSKNGGIRYAVVSLVGLEDAKPPTDLGSQFDLNQKGCHYQPHILLVPINVPVQILNNDGVLHNIHTFSKINLPMNLAHPKNVKQLEIAFKKPERVPVKCDIHGWMSAWIVAIEHPYYATTDAEGNFVLRDVPSGTYQVECWQELLGMQTAEVTINPNGVAKLDFSYKSKL